MDIKRFQEFPDSAAERMAQDEHRNDALISAIVKNRGKSILLFANSVDHSKYLAARLFLLGIPAAALSGDTSRSSRRHFIKEFQQGTIQVLCNYSVLAAGFDAPKADAVVISRPVFSPVRYMQMVGRGLRGPTNGGTATCQIITVADNLVGYGDRLAYQYCERFFQ